MHYGSGPVPDAAELEALAAAWQSKINPPYPRR